jgi:NhaP-type Na+/H+ or K+/H+ antiporter
LLTAGQWHDLRPVHFAYAALSLTVIRMLPVAVALIGTGMSRATVLFMGWFGPRGLASIVLGLVYLEHSTGHQEPTVRLAVIATVLLSILAHGLSAKPGAAWYGSQVAPDPAEDKRVS